MSTKKTDSMEWIVAEKDAGSSLRDFLATAQNISRRAAKQQIDSRAVWVNGRCIWMSHHAIKRGDRIRLAKQTAAIRKKAVRITRLPVLFEDTDYIIIDKPAGIISNKADYSAEDILRRQTGLQELRAVHRLDRDTSGCLLFAKQAAALEKAVIVFREHRLAKTYRAIVHGRWAAEATTLDLPIAGERALTHVACIRATDQASYLLIRIETGRTHQIRRHLAMARHPVLGDRHYGHKKITDQTLQEVPHVMLHAAELTLDHPLREGQLKAFAPLPDGFHAWLKLLKLGSRRG